MNLLTIRNGNLPYVVQNERWASSSVSVLISFARDLSFLLIRRFFSHIGKEFFLYGDHLAKVVLSGTPFLRAIRFVQYDRTFLDSMQYGNLLNVFTNAI